MIRTVTLLLAITMFLATLATIAFVIVGIYVGWGWFLPAIATGVIAAVAGAMTLTGTWIWALVDMDS